MPRGSDQNLQMNQNPLKEMQRHLNLQENHHPQHLLQTTAVEASATLESLASELVSRFDLS